MRHSERSTAFYALTNMRQHEVFKRIGALLIVGLMISSDVGAQQISSSAQTVCVRKHTALKFALLQPLDSATEKVGDDVPLRLSRPLIVNGTTLLSAGEIVHGRVTKVRRAQKCRNGQVEWKVTRISFADSTTAKAKILFVNTRSNFPVEDSYRHRPSEGSPDLNTADALGLALMTVAVLPFLLVSMLFEHDKADCAFGTQFLLPTGSTVVVVIAEDHRIHR